MESKVYASFSHFLNFPDTALKFEAYYFQSNLLDTQFFLKFEKKPGVRKVFSKKGKLLPKTAGIRNIFIFTRPLIYGSFLL